MAQAAPFATSATDDNIAERVTQALWTNPFLDPSTITVAVRNGVVTLAGSVDGQDALAAVFETLDDLYCCDTVVNRLLVVQSELSTAA